MLILCLESGIDHVANKNEVKMLKVGGSLQTAAWSRAWPGRLGKPTRTGWSAKKNEVNVLVTW